jgi:hypothetical protein
LQRVVRSSMVRQQGDVYYTMIWKLWFTFTNVTIKVYEYDSSKITVTFHVIFYNKMKIKNTTLWGQFQNTIEQSYKMAKSKTLTYKYISIYFSGLVQSLRPLYCLFIFYGFWLPIWYLLAIVLFVPLQWILITYLVSFGHCGWTNNTMAKRYQIGNQNPLKRNKQHNGQKIRNR